jgi:hypothetical protein
LTGDEHKLEIGGEGLNKKLKIRKRNITKIPNVLGNMSDETARVAINNIRQSVGIETIDSIDKATLNDWVLYAKSINKPHSISELFEDGDFETTDENDSLIVNQKGIAESNKALIVNIDKNILAHAAEVDEIWHAGSDDRIKINEELITNATQTLLKLRPQVYDKLKSLNSTESVKNAGLIAQEIYYEKPELRYIINIPTDATLIDNNTINNLDDIRNDPDYNNWGSTSASVDYISLIAYLVKGFQEQNTEVTSLKTQVTTLETKVSSLESQLATLQTQVNRLINQ